MQLAILHAASWLVPRHERPEWFAEWSSELWYVEEAASCQATAFCLGAFRDALWLRRNALPNPAQTRDLGSPYHSIVLLALVAAAAVFCALRWPPPPLPPGVSPGDILGLHLMLAMMAFVVLCGVNSVGLGEYPANPYAPGGLARLGRWAFFAVKSALLVLIVIVGSVHLGALGSGTVFTYFVAFRWAISDQRKRCPVCLHRLVRPIRIGEASHTFLSWYGTEFICAKGHGLLHVPEIPTSCYSTQEWLYLPSWSGLFSNG
jgi:hypothetical protein